MREIAVGRARRATLAEDDDVGVAGLGVEHILDKVQHGGTRVPEQRAHQCGEDLEPAALFRGS